MTPSKTIKGIKSRKQWAVFAPDGYIQYITISDTKKDAQNKVLWWCENTATWKDYALDGWTVSKVLVDIKIL